MKWGIRRTPKQLALASGRKAARQEKREKKSQEGQSKAAAAKVRATRLRTRSETIPSDELKKRVDRLRLEKEYKNLVRELYPKGQSRGKKIMSAFGESMLKELSKGAAKSLSGSLFGEDKSKKDKDKGSDKADGSGKKTTDSGKKAPSKKGKDTSTMSNDELIKHYISVLERRVPNKDIIGG